MNWVKRILIGVAVIGLLLGLPAAARNHGSEPRGYTGQSLDSAVSQARKRTGGRVLSAETRRIDGRPAHVVRILTKDGKVLRRMTDAETGRVLAPRRRR